MSRIELRNDPAELARLSEFVDAFCRPLPATEDDRLSLNIVLEEAATNVIKHAFPFSETHTFTVELGSDAIGRVTAVVTDDAPAYDPLARPEVDITLPLEERPIGGLGVHLIKKLVDRAAYRRQDGRNVLTLERVLGKPPRK